ncbi:MAG TPA: pitrilysin family protein [Actinomycetota bacterium]|nr:pitrilysin family protein [Actinomycetota bacterium]
MPPRFSVLCLLLPVVALALPACVLPDRGLALPVDLPFEHYELDNGLDVILRKDDRIPVASVNIWYSVGSADETEGRRGFAHLFEHMMLQGSRHAPGDYFRRLQAVGATGVNGNTSPDRTAYVEDVPSSQLELALWAESDRMGFLLDAVDLPTLRNQQSVIRNERRERVENAPYGLAQEEVYRQLFPPSHPYHHSAFGSHTDIQSAELDDVRDFFRRYYGPNNASLSIAGNIDVRRTKVLVEKYFGSLRRGPEPPEVRAEPVRITSPRRATLTDTVELPRVYLAWIVPEAFAQGDAEASLTARMLGGGKASRLYRDLVHDLQIAQSVVADHIGLAHGSVFQITATAKPGHTPGELESAIRTVLDRMAEDGPGKEELAAAKVSTKAILVKSLEATSGVADRLNAYNYFLGEPDYLQEDLERFDAVTAEDVRGFLGRFLRQTQGVTVSVVPGEKVLPPDPPAPPVDAAPSVSERRASPEPWRYEVPGPIDAPEAELPVPDTFRLDNGLTVYLVRRPELPLVTVQLTARSGSSDDPDELPGLAAFTSEMLNEGAGERGAIDIANHLTALGSTLETGSSREASWVIVQALKPNLDATAEVFADVVRRPAFPDAEVRRIRTEVLAGLQQQRSRPLTTAFKVMWAEQYGAGHPYSHLVSGTEEGVRALTRTDLVSFYEGAFVPANSALILTGDLDLREAQELAESRFGDWEGSTAQPDPVPPAAPTPERVYLVDRPGAPQTAVVLSQPAVARHDPDFEKMLLVNGVLGDLFSSRLNSRLRQVEGFTYGADSQLTQSPYPGLLHVSMSVDRPQTGRAVEVALEEVVRLRDGGMTQTELDEVRQALVRSLPNRFRTNADVAGSIAHLFALDVSQEYFRTLERTLSRVTLEDVNALLRRSLVPEAMKLVAVGDRAAVEPQLAALSLGAMAVRTGL